MTFGNLSSCQKIQNSLVGNGYLKPTGTRKAIWRGTKRVLLQRANTQKEGIDYKETFSLEELWFAFEKSSMEASSRQWYFKFHQVIISFGFEMNVIDDCVYHKFCGSKQIFLVLYVDDILLASNDIGLLHETKRFLAKTFEMKDLGKVSYVLGIEIHRDRSRGILGLSQKNYIEKVLKRYSMPDCKPGDTL
ncbi:UNVERIFIED_CONTAM: Copia protein [Sesamum angustifolium]|uniref:Copia protein n=1 Tax=Sesamum angustifolium TaxID=2727405 RepID=A0AAW2NZG6_9LAMI